MNAPQEIDQHKLGIYSKFTVKRTDGKDAPGMKHEHDEYFVLNLTTDKHTIPAIAAYASACEAGYPVLAADLRKKITEIATRDSAFITVPEVTLPCGLVVPSYRTSKYLASEGQGGIAASTAEGMPWINLNHFEIEEILKRSGYEMMSASQSLALSHDIYNVDDNWTGGKVGEGNLKQGLHKGTVSSAQPGTYISPDPEEDRWLTLSNGERIQDWSGNLYERLRDDLHGDARGLAGNIPADSPLLTTCPVKSMEKGTGWRPEGGADWSGDALIRGGCWCSGSYAGVFRLGGDWPDSRGDYVGFRCTKGL